MQEFLWGPNPMQEFGNSRNFAVVFLTPKNFARRTISFFPSPCPPQILCRNSYAGISLGSQSYAGIWEFLHRPMQDFILSATLKKHHFHAIATVFEGGLAGLAIRSCLCWLDTVTRGAMRAREATGSARTGAAGVPESRNMSGILLVLPYRFAQCLEVPKSILILKSKSASFL